MKTLFTLLALAAISPQARANADCSLDRVGLSVMVTSATGGPLGNYDAADGESEQGQNTCANYLSQFRLAYSQAKALAKEECSSVADAVDLASVEKAATANPPKRVLGSEFPAACR